MSMPVWPACLRRVQLEVKSAIVRAGRHAPDMGRMPMPRGTGILPVGLRPAFQSQWMHPARSATQPKSRSSSVGWAAA